MMRSGDGARRRNRSRLLILAFAGLISVPITPARAQSDRVRSGRQLLADLWARLDLARGYREAFRQGDECGRMQPGKSQSDLLHGYTSRINSTGPIPRDEFKELAGICSPPASACGFRQYIQDPELGEEATWGVQEALNEYMSGQLLIGNDLLLKGLRTRFPGTGDPADPDQLTLLTQSVSALGEGINGVIGELQARPHGLRASGTVNPDFRFYVENARPATAGQGSIVENELHRLTDLVYRHALAGNSLGKRKFFFGNEKPEGRQTAARSLKRAAQSTYLHTAVLTAVQSKRDFQTNNGHELKRQVVDAQRVFDDIIAGFNPLKLLGDFVPNQPVESLLTTLDLLLEIAVESEREADVRSRDYDQNETTLRAELQAQREQYLDRIAALTGIANPDTTYDLSSIEGRAALRQAAIENANAGRGELGLRSRAAAQAVADFNLAKEEERQIPDRITYEQERSGEVVRLINQTGTEVALLDFAIGLAGLIPTISKGIPSGVSSSESLSAPVVGALKAGQTVLMAAQNAKVEETNSAATQKNLLLQQITAQLARQRSNAVVEAREAELLEGYAELDRVIANFVSAQENLVCAYYTNPAYRLQLERTRQNADEDFEIAMVQSYIVAKALEYEWAERFSNPVEKTNGTLPEPIAGGSFDAIIKAESAFAARSAGAPFAPRPSLRTFRVALQLWDQRMRQLRSPAEQKGSQLTVSFRRQILGLEGGDEAFNRLAFRDFIIRHRVPGLNPARDDLIVEFPIQVADQFLFPAQPNVKVDNIEMELRSSPGRSLRGEADLDQAVQVTMAMLDSATVRTFFAKYPEDDDLLTIKLEEGRTLAQSPFRAVLQARVDGFPPSTVSNTQFENLSPAVTRWVLWIDMSPGANRALLLENLDDIEITFRYKFGRPRVITF